MKKLQDKIEYKFSEDKIFEDIMEHINGTYDAYYSKNKFQSTEFIVDCGHAEGFCIGNIIKYAQRFGKKEGMNKKELYKIGHYCIILLSTLEN